MSTFKQISSIKTASRCFIPIKNRQFTALSNNPIFYSQITYNKVAADYHLNNPLVNNNGAEETSHTQIDGEKLYINNSHLNKRRDQASGKKFEPTVYSPDYNDIHSNGGNIIE